MNLWGDLGVILLSLFQDHSTYLTKMLDGDKERLYMQRWYRFMIDETAKKSITNWLYLRFNCSIY